VEGMALGACIVSTSIGAEGVAYTNGKNIQIADSPEEWISALAYLIEHPDQMASIREQAAALAISKYDWKHLVDTFIMLYRHLLKQQ
ncbi:MAG: glycosyltransferase family 1 protein, partial [Cytophagales bacterium]|nr:glycosyltransferase family 1 protein [Cytophaga sp.]